jgi:chromate transporter
MTLRMAGQMAVTFFILSLLSFGGTVAVVPEMHRQLVETYHWMDGPTFVNLFAVAQIAPGPNAMGISLIGWKIAGLKGLLLATVAYMGPTSVLAVAAIRTVVHYQDRPVLKAVRQGLIPVATGLLTAGGIVLCRVAVTDWQGILFGLCGAVFILATERNPLWLMLGVAVGGMLLGML